MRRIAFLKPLVLGLVSYNRKLRTSSTKSKEETTQLESLSITHFMHDRGEEIINIDGNLKRSAERERI